MGKEFLRLVYRGENRWWRYLAAILVILIFGQILGAMFLGALVLKVTYDNDPTTYFDPVKIRIAGVNPLLTFIAVNCSFILLLIGIFIAVRFIHQRSIKTLFTPGRKINWSRVFQGFLFFFIFSGIASIVEYYVYPGSYQLVFNLKKYIPFFLAALIFTPLQTTAEEVLMRGYVLQATGIWIRHPLILAILNGAIFASLHLLNPEATQNLWMAMLNYFFVGVFLSLITLKDNGLELAMGIHAAINLYAATIANYQDSAIETESIFLVNKLNLEFGLVTLVLVCVIFYFTFFPSRKFWKV
ncbi:CPBP family intramembrane metalloprotease [candidate division KSB1 bacterium]|nr:CPBP family intramembrane metalloprotease [candidate division KSB1 bacterium]